MMDGGGMFFGSVVMWLILILIILGLVTFIKIILGNSSGKSDLNKETPMEILEKRYARGEIDEQEFNQRRKELEG